MASTSSSMHRPMWEVKGKVDAAIAAREPVLRAMLAEARATLDAKYSDLRSKCFPCVPHLARASWGDGEE
jgi:hypothetical protein